jgi:hypothetical protein
MVIIRILVCYLGIMSTYASVLPCQGCGSLVIYSPRHIDGLVVCSECDGGILRLVMCDASSNAKVFVNRKGVMYSYSYYENMHKPEKPPIPYSRMKTDYEHRSNNNHTFLSNHVHDICYEALHSLTGWNTFDREFRSYASRRALRYDTISKSCTVKMTGLLTRQAYAYVAGYRNDNIKTMLLNEDAQRFKEYSRIARLPKGVTIFGKDMMNNVDILRYIPVAILFEDLDTARHHFAKLVKNYNNPEITSRYNFYLDSTECMIRVCDVASALKAFYTHVSKVPVELPEDVLNHIVNLFKEITPI